MDSLSPSAISAGRRIRWAACLAALTAGALLGCAPAPAPEGEPRPAQRYDARTFHETTSIRGSSFSADETRILISSDQTGIFNVYSQPFGGGEPTPLTESTTDSIFAVSWFPEDDRFLYTADQGGNELNHLFVVELDGTVVDLTPGENLKASFSGWSGDRQSFYVVSNERDPQAFDVYRYAVTPDYGRERVFENDGSYFPGPLSKDGRWLALDKLQSNADSDVYLWKVENGELVHVTPHEGEVQHAAAAFTPDSKELYYTTDGEGEFEQVWAYDLASGGRRPVIQADWDVMYVGFSETGRYRVSAINADASTEVTIVDTGTGREVELPRLPAGDVRGVGFSRSETRLALYVDSDTSPANLYVYELATGGPASSERQLRRLSDSSNPAIDEADLVASTVVRYPSFDGLEIPAILWRPHQALSASPVPALVWVHGGPGGQTRRGYSATIQHLVNHGYAVLGVNNRGSSGYGRTFFHLDDRQHGEVDLKDCIWGRRYLESLDWVDGERVGIIGGSYGGYMVAAALAFEPEAFDLGIDIFGVTNWLRTLESIPAWWGAQREALFAELGDPATDRERLHRISPLFHAANIVRPLLVIQGANDPRVLQVESDELVEAVRASGVPVEYVLFEDEGHGFTKRANRITASEAYLQFLEQHLKRGGPAADRPSA